MKSTHAIAPETKLRSEARGALQYLVGEIVDAAMGLYEATLVLDGLAAECPLLRPALDEFAKALTRYESVTAQLRSSPAGLGADHDGVFHYPEPGPE